MTSTLNIGIFGVGVVGGGVVNLLKNKSSCVISKACVKNVDKKREDIDNSTVKYVSNPNDILDDAAINCIIETMGGTAEAWTIVRTAIKKNKHVITANKALISMYMSEIISLLESHPLVHFLYEAAVCGGIPIISVVQRSLSLDRITKVVGIMNGTTNYMLSEIESKGTPYEEVLKDAQSKGFAEADPSADVEGWDARSKLCILAKLAFGLTIDESKVPCQGIAKIRSVDFEYAKMVNHTIKLLGIAELSDHKGDSQNAEKAMTNGTTTGDLDTKPKVVLSVSPVMVPLGSPLGHIHGVTNAVQLLSENLGSSVYVGPGAGRYPSANSVVADVIELRNRLNGVPKTTTGLQAFPTKSVVSEIATDYSAEFYIRLIVDDCLGIIHKISGVLLKFNIPIFSILQIPIVDHHSVPFAIITESCFLSSIKKMVCEIHAGRDGEFNFVREDPLCLRYLK